MHNVYINSMCNIHWLCNTLHRKHGPGKIPDIKLSQGSTSRSLFWYLTLGHPKTAPYAKFDIAMCDRIGMMAPMHCPTI